MASKQPEELGLGPLEAEIMAVLWAQGPSRVSDVREVLNAGRRQALAHTTVLAVLTNLEAKHVVGHVPEGRAYRFHAALDEDQLRARQAVLATRSLLRKFDSEAVSAFVSEVEADPGLLQQLRGLIDEGDQ